MIGGVKIYNDGSHFIGIPSSKGLVGGKKMKKNYKEIVVKEEFIDFDFGGEIEQKNFLDNSLKENEKSENGGKKFVYERKTNVKDYFNELYLICKEYSKEDMIEYLKIKLKPYFKDGLLLECFIEEQLDRIKRNNIIKRTRLFRKANMHDFNYFCTFTYDDKKIKSSEFKKKLSKCFQNFSTRKGWKYIGVWEKAPVTKRLHFHGVFYIPEGTMPGVLEESKSFDFKRKDMKKFNINSFFEKRFGMNDFIEIKSNVDLKEELVYLTKYLEKSNEKIVYSRGLNTYIVSDIQKSDIACNTGQSGKKLVLYDDFTLWDVGELIGKVSKENINKMPKAN